MIDGSTAILSRVKESKTVKKRDGTSEIFKSSILIWTSSTGQLFDNLINNVIIVISIDV